MKKNERNGAPLIEIICSVAIIAVVGSIVVSIFLGSHYAAIYASDKNSAVFMAQNVVENALAGDTQSLSTLGFGVDDMKESGTYTTFFDENWEKGGEMFRVELSLENDGTFLFASVTVAREQDYPFLREERAALYNLDGVRRLEGVVD